MASNRNYKPAKEGYKSTKTELIAIYRLEFYKNKKNWMLCHDIKKEPTHSTSSTSQSKKLLNETYNIEPEMEQVSPHNQAFLQEDSDDAPDIPPAPNPQVYVPAAPAPHNLYQHTWVDQPWPEEKSEVVWQDAQQEWCGVEAEGGAAEGADLTACPQPTWPPVNPIRTYEHVDAECEVEQPAELVRLAEEWLQSHGYPLHHHQYAPYYHQYGLDESAEFIRGAHGVPHSSEIDLISHDCPMLGVGPLYGLSERALCDAAHAHVAVLRAILTEQALREKLHFTTANLSLPIPLEEFPTRDTDPPRVSDMLLSGSHRPTSDIGRGRGRGRLHTDRLIGIGMGRPYRL